MSLYHYYRSRERFAGMLSRLRGSAQRSFLAAEGGRDAKNSGAGLPSTLTGAGPRYATPEAKRSGNFSRRNYMRIFKCEGLKMCPHCLCIAYESHVSQCMPEAKAVTASIRRALKEIEFIDWCIRADKQGITGSYLVDLYRDNEFSTCETIIAVLAGSIKDNKDPSVHAQFILAFAAMREGITW